MTSTIVKMHDIDQCDDAELVRRKTTAMFGGFITKEAPEYGTESDTPSNYVLGSKTDDDAEGHTVIAMEPGTFPELPEGWDVKFAEPKDVSGSYIAWMKQQLRSVARGIGVTYEQLTGDLEGVNYSSIRAGLLEFRRLCEMHQMQTLVYQLCRPVSHQWLKTAVLSGMVKIKDYLENARAYNRVNWRPQGWAWVDPVKDQKAEVISVRAGFKSRARVVAEQGFDVETVDAEIKEDNSRADGFDFIFDTDPRNTSASGVYQEAGGKNDED